MPDIYMRVREAAPKILERLMTALEIRAADPQQRPMLNTYLGDVALPPNSRVLEIGCGTVFEGDYATATLATRAGDPLNVCAEAFREQFVHDRGW